MKMLNIIKEKTRRAFIIGRKYIYEITPEGNKGTTLTVYSRATECSAFYTYRSGRWVSVDPWELNRCFTELLRIVQADERKVMARERSYNEFVGG